jgi:leader peptidase (prepilin peptidase)/N-methyltransferase
MLIPDKFTIPAIVFVFVMNTGFQIISLSSMLLGMVVVGGFFLVQFLLSQGAWVGGGDIRMGVLMGCLLGVTNGLVALFLSYFIGAIVGGGLLLLKRVNRKTRMPFGTFLVTGTVIVLLTGSSLFHWYFALLQV